MPNPPLPRAAYVHVPFCAQRCGYCNFTLVAGRDDLVPDYLRAIEQELSLLGEPREVDTLFLGGGTPTQLQPDDLARLLAIVGRWHPLAEGGEASCEANPADLGAEKVAVLAETGVTRLSLGAQSFDANKLQRLERDHRAEDIRRAVELARPRLQSLSLDLIFAAPDESLDGWRGDLDAALALEPDHLSTYGLTFEKGATFWSRLQQDELKQAGDALERAMYTTAIETLCDAGFEHYEVSNFARPGHRCRHNEVYWTGGGYYAVGPGAARYVDGRREVNHRSTTTWLKRVLAGQSPVAEAETLEPEDSARERLVFGLRRLEGVRRADFIAATGFDFDVLAGPPLQRFVAANLLADNGQFVRLTRAGLLVSDSLWPEFLRC
jgi:oxygen-independent coproporphyrinogen-3 oxidase